jgi:DnaK suppressor protein
MKKNKAKIAKNSIKNKKKVLVSSKKIKKNTLTKKIKKPKKVAKKKPAAITKKSKITSATKKKTVAPKKSPSIKSIATPVKPTPIKTVASTVLNLNIKSKKSAAISGPTGIKPYKAAKDEAYMNPQQLEHFKNILNIWKEQLMSEMSRTVQHMKNDAANFPDPVDRASQEEEFNLELKTRERERKLLKKIDESLEKIQGGDYGYCLDCGAEIGVKRLEARPTATQCIECKTIAEIREKQTGG